MPPMRKRFRSRRRAARWRDPQMGVASAVGGIGCDEKTDARASTLGRNTVTAFHRGQGSRRGWCKYGESLLGSQQVFAEILGRSEKSARSENGGGRARGTTNRQRTEHSAHWSDALRTLSGDP